MLMRASFCMRVGCMIGRFGKDLGSWDGGGGGSVLH